MRKAVLALQIALLVLGLGFYVQRNMVRAGRLVDDTRSDFSNYWDAARAMLEGASPYVVHNFDYPALVALVTLPVAAADYPTARLVWFCFSHLCLLVAALLLWWRLGRDLLAAVVVTVVWAGAGTVAENLVLGQVNPLLLLLLTLALVAPARAGAVALAVATALKLWPGILLLREAIVGRWRGFFSGSALATLLVAGPLVGIALLLPPPHLPASSVYWAGTPALLNFSFPATALRLVTWPGEDGALPRSWLVGNDPRALELEPWQRGVSVAVAGLVLLGGLVVIALAQRRRAIGPGASLCGLVAVALAAAPICW